MNDLSQAIAELSEGQRELFERLMAEEQAARPEHLVAQFASGEVAPLSFAQERLWFTAQMSAAGHVAYNIPAALRLQGPLDRERLVSALTRVVERHGALRTLIVRQATVHGEGSWSQTLKEAPGSVALPWLDLTRLEPRSRQRHVARLVHEEASRPFDLTKDLLLRARLLRLEEEDHVLLVSTHHFAADGWSIGILVQELALFYDSADAVAPPLPVQYADYASWQRRRQDQIVARELGFWRQRLTGVPALHELPLDRPRSATQDFQGASVNFKLPSELSSALNELSRQRGTTMFMTLLAAFKVLLLRHSHNEEVVVGTAVSNRDRSELEGLIGNFSNNIVLRDRLAHKSSFVQFLEQIRDTTTAAFAHQELPFEALVSKLQLERSLSHHPIFQIVFVYHQMSVRQARLADLELEVLDAQTPFSRFDLTLEMRRADDRLGGLLEFDTRLFDGTTIGRWVSRLEILLRGIVADPTEALEALPLLSCEESHQLLVEFDDTVLDYGSKAERSLQELISAQAVVSPDGTALVKSEIHLSYSMLETRVSSLAARLQALGVRTDSIVGVCLERSPEMILALLAILRAGGAYLPVDPEDPEERRCRILAAAGIRLLWTHGEFWPSGEPEVTDLFDPRNVEGESVPDFVEPQPRSPERLAYVIYTSGSTGVPKGVMVSHRAIVNRLLWMQRRYQLSGADRVLQKTTLTFDVSVWECFWPLLTGATLVLAPPGAQRERETLAALICQNRVTTLHFVPSMLSAFLPPPTAWDLGSLRWVIASGEALSNDLAEQFDQHLGTSGARLQNLYGPTEAAIDVTAGPCQDVDRTGVPIGRAIDNVRVHLLDARFRAVPLGVSGELVIGGAAPARGYLGAPGLTAQRFVPDPFSRRGGRLYRSGDLVRRLASGEIEFLGRFDHQVKIRGFRVELGEIEAALETYPRITRAVAIAWGGGETASRLVAYVTSDSDPHPKPEELRAFLAPVLPPYMVPAIFVVLDAFPLTASGKIDRRALPAPSSERPELSPPYVPPRTTTEAFLAQVWGDALGISRVGIHDDFFALGGDSILGLQILGRLADRGIPFHLPDLFRYRTIHALARAEAHADEARADSVPEDPGAFGLLSPTDRERIPAGIVDAYPLTLLQQGMVYHMERDPSAALFHNIDRFVLRGRIDSVALWDAMRRLVERHPALRTAIDFSGYGEPLQLVQAQVENPLRSVDLRALSPAAQRREAARWFAVEINLPFDIGRPPLVRLRIFLLEEDLAELVVTQHHAVLDGWSLNTLLAEFFEIYHGLCADQEVELPPVALWRQAVALERAALESSTTQDFWRRELHGAEPSLVPSWTVVREESMGDGEWRHELSTEQAAALRQLARRIQLPLKSLFLAAYFKVLAAACGRRDLVTGLITDVRPEVTGAERLLGLFLNTVPLRLSVECATWEQLALTAFHAERRILAHRRYPLAQLQRDRGGESLFNTTFNFIHFHVVHALRNEGQVELIGGGSFLRSDEALGLTVEIDPAEPDRITLYLHHDPARVTRMQTKMLGDLLLRVLGRMADDPVSCPSDLSIFSPAQRHHLVVEVNDTLCEEPPNVVDQIVAQAKQHRDVVALVDGTRAWTFAGLVRAATNLAVQLLAQGVVTEDRVGICCERRAETAIALLAVMRAGGAYVPLGPELPKARRKALAKASGVALCLVDASRPEFAGDVPTLSIGPDGALAQASGPPAGMLGGTTILPEQAAYLLFTSGSTGRPKGVEVNHRGLANHCLAVGRAFGLEQGERVLQFSGLAFDVAAEEYFGSWVMGATVLLPPESTSGSRFLTFQDLDAVMQRERITVANLPGSYWQSWVGELAQVKTKLPATLRQVVVGSEAVPTSAWSRWQQVRSNRVHLCNAYGATETTIGPLLWEDSRALPSGLTALPIGRPLNNTQVFVLDPRTLAPTWIGTPGELFLAGPALARGYSNQPAATAKRFLPHPFAQAGERLYRTGDRARWLPEGELEFLGRTDRQLKIRGFRVEPEEIRATLNDHPAVGEAVVVPRSDSRGDLQLVAYVVPRPECSLTVEDLRGQAVAELPEYMVPGAFEILTDLPRTSGGKVDLRALPAVSLPAAEARTSKVVPRNPAEQVLAGLFSELFAGREIGVHENFFALGGESLLATRLIFRIRHAFEVDLSLADLFTAPTVAGLAARVATLQRGDGGGGAVDQLPQIVPNATGQEEPFPLTDVQQAYWIGREEAFELGQVAAHGYQELEVTDLDLQRFEASLNRLIERHGMLRAVVTPDGQQRILDQVPTYAMPVLDLRNDDPEEARERLLAVRREMSHQVLPADRWPLFDIRATLIEGHRSCLHISTDALIADAWSLVHLMAELFALYEQPNLELVPLDISFRDYVLAEEALGETEIFRVSRRYWRERLETLPPAPELPRRVIEPGRTPHFERCHGRLSEKYWSLLKERALRAGLTPSSVLLAAYAEVLALWSGQPRFTLNLTLFNRLPLHPQVQRLIGDFTSLSLLEVDYSMPDTWIHRARALQNRLWQDLDHRYYNGVQVLRDLMQARGGVSGAAMPVVFTSALGLAPTEGTAPEASGPEIEETFGITQTPQVWLDQQVSEDQGELYYNWDFVAEIFPPGLVNAMFVAYGRLLEALATSEEAWQATHPAWLLTAEELAPRRQANATDGSCSSETLISLFEDQAICEPDRIAIVAPESCFSYGEVSALVRHFARRLLESQVNPGELVAVVMEKGWEQTVACLAIMRIGAAYLPLSARLPQERFQYLLERGQVKAALTQEAWFSSLPWPDEVTPVAITAHPDAIEDPKSELKVAMPEPSDLAYVIFTSGSTGEPKGVMIDHRGAVNTLRDIHQRFGVTSRDRVLAISSLHFDLSVYDIFGLLALGGTVVVPSASREREPSYWAEQMVDERVTVWNSVPALMDLYVEYVAGHPDQRSKDLRLVMMSGDWIPLSLPDRIRALAPEAQVISLGGATEASIWSIFFPIEEVDPRWPSIPYGRPLLHQRFHVLDEHLQPRPTWVPGQLYIAGDGLALGYWRAAKVTAESFIPHPETGERLYRTGDLGRYLPDGHIEFLGRKDFQVKVHGYRVELGEIEAALGQLEGVLEAVVSVFGEARDQKRLVAYVVPTVGSDLEADTLKAGLRAKLPDYMVPPSFVILEQFPLTANGKVDRRALPEPHRAGSTARADRGSTSPWLDGLAELWGQVLGLDQVTPEDSFFELGGNSLVAIRMISKLQDSFGIRVPLVDFLSNPTLGGLAEILEREHVSGATGLEVIPTIEPDVQARSEFFPLTDIQQAYWVGRRQNVELGNVASHSYTEIEFESLDLDRLQLALRRLIDRHDMLRAVVSTDGRQRILERLPAFEIPIRDLRSLDEEAIEAGLVEIRQRMSHQVLDPETWPLFEIVACLLPGERIRLHFSADLLIADAWSFQILLGDLTTFYLDPERDLLPIEISFRDYVLGEVRLRDSQTYQQARIYWLDRLESLPPAPELPLIRQPATITRPRFDRVFAEHDAATWDRLKALGAKIELTPSGLLLAVFGEVLAQWCRRPTFTVNLTTFHRVTLHPQVDQLVGDFTSTTLVAFDGSPPTFEERARQLQHQLWRDLEHRDFSGVEVLRALSRHHRQAHRASMPVVFTSTLIQGGLAAEGPIAVGEQAPWQAKTVYGVSQTPQVLLDCQIGEEDGRLRYNWDFVEQVYPPGLVQDMISAYAERLNRLAEEEP